MMIYDIYPATYKCVHVHVFPVMHYFRDETDSKFLINSSLTINVLATTETYPHWVKNVSLLHFFPAGDQTPQLSVIQTFRFVTLNVQKPVKLRFVSPHFNIFHRRSHKHLGFNLKWIRVLDVQWSLRFKTLLFNNSLHFKTDQSGDRLRYFQYKYPDLFDTISNLRPYFWD